jgi:hypothetical protein
MRCQICHRTVAYRPGKASEVLTEHYSRAHPKRLPFLPGSRAPQIPALTADGHRRRPPTRDDLDAGHRQRAPAMTENGRLVVMART